MDIICKCGHGRKMHNPEVWKERRQYKINEYILEACYAEGTHQGISDYLCRCNQYVPDNLSFIETLAKQKGLI